MNKGFVLITGVSTGIGYDATGYLIGQGIMFLEVCVSKMMSID